MNRIKYYTKLWIGYQHMGISTMTQYPLDTFILIISMLLREASGFIGVFAIANVAGGIGNWHTYEICLLFSMCAIIESIGQTFFDNVWGISYLVREGQMDKMIVRPASIFFQMICDAIHMQAIISMFIYISIMIYSMKRLGISCSVGLILFLMEFIICGSVINTGIYMVFNCLDFWVVQGKDVAVLIQTCREFVKYPIGVFPGVIRIIFTYVLPFGFVGYYPAAYILGKTGNWVLWGMPLCALAVSIVAGLFWRFGTKSYNSTGT